MTVKSWFFPLIYFNPFISKSHTILVRLFMKKGANIFTFLLISIGIDAQVSFKTMVPQQPVIAGESFQVQYIIEDGDKSMNVRPPLFNNFRFVSGPNVYMGSVSTAKGQKPLRNAVYTLEAIRPGKFIIQGAAITINGKVLRSNDALVVVISKEEALPADSSRDNKENGINASVYFLQPGENPFDKIKQNLFVKLMVNKQSCFVGEPVLATFKLYSRLESQSAIIKNPGFYGFTVYDIENLSDKQVAKEKINGKIFDVHTIRKVQLYPLQPGVFTIDAMQVKNKVEFSHSPVNKKADQEIIEGVTGNNGNDSKAEGTDIVETDIITLPVTVRVKPLPAKNQPTGFEGAIGRFSIAALMTKDNLAKNEEGFFEITLSGKGNFIQLSPPSVQWPAGIESFETIVQDNLNKNTIPLTGSRTFRYPFVCTVPGSYQFPGIKISFFDTVSTNYKTITTNKVGLLVRNEDKKKNVIEEHKTSIAKNAEKAARIAGVIVVCLVLLILVYWIFRKNPTEKKLPEQQEPALISIRDLLDPAYAAISAENKKFYAVLHGIVWEFIAQKFSLSGSGMKKQTLVDKMREVNSKKSVADNLMQVLEQCETGMFTNASLSDDRNRLLMQAKEVMENIDIPGSQHSSF